MNRLKYLRLIKGLAIILIAFLFTRCMHDEFQLDKLNTDVEVEFGFFAPVAYGTLTISDLVQDIDSAVTINTYEDGLLYLSFSDSLFAYSSEAILEVPDQDFFEYFIESEFFFPPLWDTVSIEKSENFPFSFSRNEKIDSIKLDAGDMIFNINSEFRHTGKIIISCPTIRKDGHFFSDTIIVDDPSGTFTTNNTFPLDGYTIILNDSVGSDSSFLPVDFLVELYREGLNTINPGDQIEIVATIANLDFDAVFGYIGDYEIMGDASSIELDLFDSEMFDGTIRFADPQINFNIRNSFGVPVEANIERFVSYNSDGDSLQLIMDATVNPYQFEFPTLAEYGETKSFTWALNASNTNLPDFMAFLPSSIEYKIAAASNPDGPGAAYNFVSDDSKLDIDIEFILPIWFRADFALMDTIELDLADIGKDADMIKQGNILLTANNGTPIDLELQVYFVDSLYAPVDTLFGAGQQPLIAAGILDINNIVQYPGTKTSLVQYTSEEIKNLETVRYAIIKAGLKTPQYDSDVNVKFFDYYTFDFKISVDVDFKINSKDL
ncbi:MAG: hypothetical protein A2W99_10755 [Bacteroidetes bacterium GWF2_33_16]|nr:MAG: hypothetical protein A2X00_04985 [Bacteroidetes bacterium GWE2_32_14]OFY04018.1 MAG: hypothetical protein A2W99_10755 [Bacteroidetes bacterium GWF2_33_16]